MIEFKEVSTYSDQLCTEWVSLMERTQGTNVVSKGYFENAVTDPNSFCICAFDDGVFVGSAVATLIHEFDFYLPFGTDIVEKMKSSRVGSMSIMGIHESYQGKGLGQKLSQKRLEWLKSHNCNLVVGISWVSGLAHTSNRVFEKTGFTAYNKLDGFFREWSEKRNLICPVCGNPPCNCPAILYVKEL